MELDGIHHLTAMASDAARNVAFYTGVLGLRLVKKTVNFDDPTTYHLYYGDRTGSPGTIITFFPWKGSRRGRTGKGQVTSFAFRVPVGSLPFWAEHLRSKSVATTGPDLVFGEPALCCLDPDGFRIRLVESDLAGSSIFSYSSDSCTAHNGVGAEHAIRCFHSATLSVDALGPSADLLEKMMEARREKEDVDQIRYRLGEGSTMSFIDLESPEGMREGTMGTGIVHHIAWRTASADSQAEARRELVDAGFGVSPIMDRKYFQSIYFREPGGILFEIATDPPGFAVDEDVETLGERLMLPDWLETLRMLIESSLPPLDNADAA